MTGNSFVVSSNFEVLDKNQSKFCLAQTLLMAVILNVALWLMNVGSSNKRQTTRYEEKELYLQELVFTRERLLVIRI